MIEPKPKDSRTWTIVMIAVALIGCTGVIGAALIGTLLKTNIDFPSSQVPSTIVVESSSTASPESQIEPTNTSLEFPIETTIPSLPPNPDMPPGTILEVGQTWRQDGLEMKLVNGYPFLSERNKLNGVVLDGFEITNRKSESVILTPVTFGATDNQQRTLQFGFANCVDCNYESGFEIVDSAPSLVLASQETATYGIYVQAHFKYFVNVDITDLTLTEVIVTVSVSSIQNAQWRIRINH